MTLRRSPGFFALAVALLASGLAAVTILFTVADALLLKPLAAPAPAELVRFVSVLPQLGGARSAFRLENWETWRRQSASFVQLGAVHETSLAYRDGDRQERVQVALTSPEWLETFGVAARFASAQSLLLSHRFWQSRYGGRPVLGREVRLHGQPFTIAGVLPAGFNGATVERGPDVRVPLAALPALIPSAEERRDLDYEISGRLKPGVERDRARDEAYRLYRAARNPELDGDLKPHEFDLESLEFGASRLRTQTRGAVWFATGAAALLALMVCLNLSGLLLARMAGRETEFAVRQALGATRPQVAALVAAEVAAIVGSAALAAGALTVAGLQWIGSVLPPVRLLGRQATPMALRLDPDWRILLFGVAASIAALALVALAPAWRAARADLHPTLRSARATASRGRPLLLALQGALCTMLLLAAWLAHESLDRLRAQTDPARIVNADVDSRLVPGLSDERYARLLEQWALKIRALPGVETAAYSGVRRLRGSGLKMTIVPEGERAQPAQFMNTSTMPAGGAYLEANRIPLVAGRNLTETERYDKPEPQPVVVSEAFARLYGGSRAILGRRFGPARPGQTAKGALVVVGVAADTVYRHMREQAPPVVYSPLGGVSTRMTLTVRTALPAAALAPALRRSLREVSPDLTLEEISDLSGDVEASLWNERAVAFVASLFAGLATAIIAAGLFAFVAYLVSTRRREMAIRLAVGAPSSSIFRLVLRQGLWPVASGVAAGLAAGAALARLAESILYGVAPGQPLAPAMVGSAMLLTAVLACLWPAWQASRIEPASALRTE